jgi:two-component system sensor histidine kinase BaeS
VSCFGWMNGSAIAPSDWSRWRARAAFQMRFDLAPVTVPGDGERMDQVIANLLTNAFHYNREPGEVRVVTRIENGDAVLEVTDTGIGIAPEDVPHVFERFYRADKSRARAEGRAGLGLAISQAIVGQHGGSLSVASRLGHGSAFTVRLPGAVAGDAAPLADGNDRSQPVP